MVNAYFEGQIAMLLIAKNKEGSDEWYEIDEIPLIKLKSNLEASTNKIDEELSLKGKVRNPASYKEYDGCTKNLQVRW